MYGMTNERGANDPIVSTKRMCDSKSSIETKGGDENDEGDEDDVDDGQGRTSGLRVDIVWLRPGFDDLLGRMHAG